MKVKGNISRIACNLDRPIVLARLQSRLEELGARHVRSTGDGVGEFGPRSWELSNPWWTIVPFDYGRMEIDWNGPRVRYVLAVRMFLLLIGVPCALMLLSLGLEGGWALGLAVAAGVYVTALLIGVVPAVFKIRNTILGSFWGNSESSG